METSLVKMERTCLLCSHFPGCPIYLKMGRALETFDEHKIKALYYTLAEVCEFFGTYKEDPYIKSRSVEYGMLRRITEAAEQGKIIVIGKINENGTGSRVVSVFLQGIYDTEEEAQIFTKDMDVVRMKELSRNPSLVSAPHPEE